MGLFIQGLGRRSDPDFDKKNPSLTRELAGGTSRGSSLSNSGGGSLSNQAAPPQNTRPANRQSRREGAQR